MECITYKAGYKYQLRETYSTRLEFHPPRAIATDYVEFSVDGRLTLARGYAWDGPSGPTFDTLNFMRGSLVHDALYQLIRIGHLSDDPYRALADRVLRRICREDGMSALRAWWVYQGVRLGGAPAVDPASERPLVRAPRACRRAG